MGLKTTLASAAPGLLASALAVAAAPDARGAIIADLGADYIDADTLPANYSYLMSDLNISGTEVALTGGNLVGNGGNRGFGGGRNGSNMAAVLGAQDGGAEFEIFSNGFEGNGGVAGTDLLLHPGNDGDADNVIIRRTITADDLTDGNQATIAGRFRNQVGTSEVVFYVYQNTNQLGGRGFIGSGDGTYAFNLTTTLAVGDTIDFVVWSFVDFSSDETALRATIDVVPEPGSLALLGLGGLMLMRRRRNG